MSAHRIDLGRPSTPATVQAIKALPTYVAPKVTASTVRLVQKRKVLVLNGQFRPKRPKNGLYQGHTARANAGNSTSEAFLKGGR
eukprot:COSAG02_NODE_2248_length_9373_cov_31.225361_2_plen_84_part_00